MAATLYIDIIGEDAEHAERMAGIIGDIMRGARLMAGTRDSNRFGSAAQFGLDANREGKRLSMAFPGPGSARKAGESIAQWLTANGWAHGDDRVLLGVFIVDGEGNPTTITDGYGAVGFIDAVECVERVQEERRRAFSQAHIDTIREPQWADYA